MPDGKSEGEGSAMDEPPDHTDCVDFAEIDQTGRYGRYSEVLGKGSSKTVYRAFDEVEGIEVAWNQVKIQDLLQSPEEFERLYCEVNLLKSLKHKNIIKLYHSWLDMKNKNVNFITEIFTSGTLRQYRKKHKQVDIKAVKNWARQILRGLLYLHSHDPPIIHRDLKCDNIFVNGNNGEVKIGDLGLATILRQAHAAHSVIGTPEFMAPELYEEEYNELVDIYSFGMCLLEMVTFEYPYSECENAAQIYKKVSSGKKPAALDRVKNPDVREFIEKCLAPASKRLPARELLTDPFLQSDGTRDHLEPLLSIPQTKLVGDDMDELMVKESGSRYRNEASFSRLTYLSLSNADVKYGYESGQSKGSTAFLTSGGDKDIDVDGVDKDIEMGNAYSPSDPLSKDNQPRISRDFRVKGKKRDESTVFLRLRIADAQGHIRNIHFLFDIEGDTAMSVASEMVAELDLSDQDVTTIAEMIDAEILALVPGWQPGASFDEAVPDTEDCGDQVELSPDRSHEKAKGEADCDDATGVDGPCLEELQNDHSSSVQLATATHGGIEEVTCNRGGSDYSPSSSGVLPLSSIPSEHHDGEKECICLAGDPSSPASDYIERGTWSSVLESMGVPCLDSSSNVANTGPGDSENAAFNDLVESRRNAGCSRYTHQTWEGIMNMSAGSEGLVGFAHGERDASSEDCYLQPSWSEFEPALCTPSECFDGAEVMDRELKLLTLRHEQELLDLQKKHQQAFLEVKSRWERRSGSTRSLHLASPGTVDIDPALDSVRIKQEADCINIQASSQSSLELEAGFSNAFKLRFNNQKTAELPMKEPAAVAAKIASVESIECSYAGASAFQDTMACESGTFEFPPASDLNQSQDAMSGAAVGDVVTWGGCSHGLDLLSVTCLGSASAVESSASTDSFTTEGQQKMVNSARLENARGDLPNTQKLEKNEQMNKGRRESYIEFYKTSGFDREKFGSSRNERQGSEASAQESLSKVPSFKNDDWTRELKKEQLQRSIAELEAKTLEGLDCSKNGLLSSHALKKHSGSSSVQYSSTASQT